MDITVATLIYKSNQYLDFVIDSLLAHDSKIHNVKYLIVANDADPHVLEYLKDPRFNNEKVRHVVHDSDDKNEWWIQRVYGAWNRCLNEADTEAVCFVNSDMAFTDGWLDSLARYDLGRFVPTSRLVESARMPSLAGLISKNFGQTLGSFDKQAFEDFAEELKKQPGFTPGIGAFMPSLFKTETLKKIGGWHKNIGNLPGDKITFALLAKHLGMVNVMVHDSVVYHFQRGESVETGDLQ
jgi:hypothetical protein